MDIHLLDIMEIMDIPAIMAIGPTHLTDIMDIPDIMVTGTILIMGTDLTVIRIANMAAELLCRIHVSVVRTRRFLASTFGPIL
jgi:hypothetical protein